MFVLVTEATRCGNAVLETRLYRQLNLPTYCPEAVPTVSSMAFLAEGHAASSMDWRMQARLLGDHRALDPPDPIPNSAVKQCIADGSVGFPHVRVGHRQALN